MEQRILIIEDDPRIVDLLTLHLSEEGYLCAAASKGRTGLDKLREEEFSLLILDLMLPDISGMEVCGEARRDGIGLPIMMLTARGDEYDKVLGLELGADDYMTKPFGIRELKARVRALLRRSGSPQTAEAGEEPSLAPIRSGELVIHPDKRTAELDSRRLDLTTKEFELLLLFVSNPGRAYSRDELLRRVWGYQFEGYQHTVNSHINRLRGKIEENPGEPRFIETVWGYGYRFREEERP